MTLLALGALFVYAFAWTAVALYVWVKDSRSEDLRARLEPYSLKR